MVQVHLDEVLPPVAVPPPPARALGAIAHVLSQQDRERTTASSSNGMCVCGCVCVAVCVAVWLCAAVCVCVSLTYWVRLLVGPAMTCYRCDLALGRRQCVAS